VLGGRAVGREGLELFFGKPNSLNSERKRERIWKKKKKIYLSLEKARLWEKEDHLTGGGSSFQKKKRRGHIPKTTPQKKTHPERRFEKSLPEGVQRETWNIQPGGGN